MLERWMAVMEPEFPWEREALTYVCECLPEQDPFRAWSNFEFIAEDGSINEVDLLVVSLYKIYLVEIKSRPGRVSGDAGTWTWTDEGRVFTDDNPLLLANRKAKKLKSLLQHQSALRNSRVPFIEPLIFLSALGLRCELTGAARNGVCVRKDNGQEGLWRIVIDFPFDREEYTPKDHRAKLQEFEDTGQFSNCLVCVPSFFTPKAMEDLGRLVLLDHVLSGNNLNQYGSHLSQIEREQARILLQNQQGQMRQRIRNYMLAAYGISTMDREAIDSSHDLDEHFRSLNPVLTLQPPVGASFKDALEHLFFQALAHQFPAHPHFEGEVKLAALKRVLGVIQRATQVRDGRIEVERPLRDEVLRIAVPLRLGDMGETHFVLRDEWKSRFLRKKAEEGATNLTVRHLRTWTGQPQAMGLPTDIQNLVILSFALQSDLSFYLHGRPMEPQLERLDDELEVREQALPSEETWKTATQRVAAVFGITSSPLLNAANVAKLVADVNAAAERCRRSVERLCGNLRQRLQTFGVETPTAPRMQTAQAALTFLSALMEANKDAVVEVIVAATIATSEVAMGESIKKAAELTDALDRTHWPLFETIRQMPADRAPEAHAILEKVRDALTRDEHVMALAGSLQEAQHSAQALVDRIVEEIIPPPQPRKKPEPSRRPSATVEPAGSRQGLGGSEAVALFEAIQKQLASDPELLLDLNWRLHHKDGDPA